MKGIGKIICILLIRLFLFNVCPAQHWNNLALENPAAAAAHWKKLRTPPGAGLVALPSGGSALYLTGPFSDYNSGAIFQTVPYSTKILQRYRATAMIKTARAAGNGASLYAYGKIGDQVIGYASSAVISGDADWQEVSLTIIADDRLDSMRLGCYLDGVGEAWFKDLRWEQLPLPASETKKEVVQYLDTFFQLVGANALYRENFDWAALRAAADRLTAGARETTEVHDALQYILQRVNKHSRIFPPRVAAAWSGNTEVAEALRLSDYPEGRKIDAQISYVTVPHFAGGHAPTMIHYADTLQALIASLDSPETTGWVVDLRGNTGGNCWPMLAGIGPVLGEGTCGYFMEPDGTNAEAWAYKKGRSYHGDTPRVSVSGKPYRLKEKQAKIAVLTDAQTMSSGEVVAVAFRGRPNTRSFGQPTGGYSTTNTNFNLSDGAMVLLTVSVYGDREKNVYGEQIMPDVTIGPTEGEDAVLAAAIGWLRE